MSILGTIDNAHGIREMNQAEANDMANGEITVTKNGRSNMYEVRMYVAVTDGYLVLAAFRTSWDAYQWAHEYRMKEQA